MIEFPLQDGCYGDKSPSGFGVLGGVDQPADVRPLPVIELAGFQQVGDEPLGRSVEDRIDQFSDHARSGGLSAWSSPTRGSPAGCAAVDEPFAEHDFEHGGHRGGGDRPPATRRPWQSGPSRRGRPARGPAILPIRRRSGGCSVVAPWVFFSGRERCSYSSEIEDARQMDFRAERNRIGHRSKRGVRQ